VRQAGNKPPRDGVGLGHPPSPVAAADPALGPVHSARFRSKTAGAIRDHRRRKPSLYFCGARTGAAEAAAVVTGREASIPHVSVPFPRRDREGDLTATASQAPLAPPARTLWLLFFLKRGTGSPPSLAPVRPAPAGVTRCSSTKPPRHCMHPTTKVTPKTKPFRASFLSLSRPGCLVSSANPPK
jgi:hypothetical protein